MSDKEDITEVEVEEQPKRIKKKITDKQKAARIKNLAKGRATRAKNIKARATAKKAPEYDLGDTSDETESEEEVDLDSFVLSKKKAKSVKSKKAERTEDPVVEDVRKEMQEMREVMAAMAKKQKSLRRPRKEGGTKLVILPNQQESKSKENSAEYNTTFNQLLRAIGRK